MTTANTQIHDTARPDAPQRVTRAMLLIVLSWEAGATTLAEALSALRLETPRELLDLERHLVGEGRELARELAE